MKRVGWQKYNSSSLGIGWIFEISWRELRTRWKTLHEISLFMNFWKEQQQGICRNLNEFFERVRCCLSIFHLMLRSGIEWCSVERGVWDRLVADQWWMIKNFKMQTRVTDEIWENVPSSFSFSGEGVSSMRRILRMKNVKSLLWHSWTSLIMKLSTRQREREKSECNI